MSQKTVLRAIFCVSLLLMVCFSVYSLPIQPYGGPLVGGFFDTQDPTLPETPEATFNQELLHAAIQFFAYQRCGDADNPLLENHELGPTCHLQDGEAISLDLTGGWHDAGDHVKVTLTTAYSVYGLLKAYEAFPESFDDQDDREHSGSPNGIPDVLDEAQIGLDYLEKAHPSDDVLIAMVGNPDYDHRNWVTSPYQSTLSIDNGGGARPVYTESYADIAGTTAAAFAQAALVYEEIDPAAAQRYITKAKSAYVIGKNNQKTTPTPIYSQGEWRDDMMCGATELYRATRETAYLNDALNYDNQLGSHYWVLDWGTVSDICRHSLAKEGQAAPLEHWQTDVNNYLTKVSDDQYINGLAYFGPWGSLRYALDSAFSASLLYDLIGDEEYKAFALGQLDYVKGENEYDRTLIVGLGVNPPENPHHRNSYGYDDYSMDENRDHKYPIIGALVGGPNAEGPYVDTMYDYQRNEVAIDSNTGLVGITAFAVREEQS